MLKSHLPEPLLGVYLNPDEIEQGVKELGYVDLLGFGIQTTSNSLACIYKMPSNFLCCRQARPHRKVRAAAGMVNAEARG
ncbi:MAG: hypothetical protein B7Z37_03685 [Verrucomicrobia bacterium 12-59-8]|nr:MAG: hypothetical protein B7Z37_03685 [Verrucomicrobia bacterium 12-59-8]